MVRNDINYEYFEWLCDIVHSKSDSYTKLLRFLHDTEFRWIIEKDKNRANCGIDLRYRFVVSNGYHKRVMDEIEGPCSVLEMMLALAIHCEENIMDDPRKGDRTSQWFWGMIRSLGLNSMTDNRFDERLVEDIIERFLDREYEPNGKGGLFTIKDIDCDLRDVEIWYQLCWYLDSFIDY